MIRNEKSAADPEPKQDASMYPEPKLNPKYDEQQQDSRYPEEPVYEATGPENMESGYVMGVYLNNTISSVQKVLTHFI